MNIDEPFAADILAKAKDIAEHYTYCISTDTSDNDDTEKSKGDCVEIEAIVATGYDSEDCLINLKKYATVVVATMLEMGGKPPAPGSYLYGYGKYPINIDDVTEEEESSLKDNICPDCSGVGLLEGPCGGGSINVMCANGKCKARFNFIWPFTPQRLTYGIAKLDALRSLPPVTEFPPMPKCKPPKAEDEDTCDSCLYKVDADGGDGISCIHVHRTGCTLDYQSCSWYETDRETKIESIDQIIDKLTEDGDFRKGEFDYPYICFEDDDLGFYQQACTFLIEALAEIQTCKKGHKFVAKSHEYVCPLCQLDEVRKHLS